MTCQMEFNSKQNRHLPAFLLLFLLDGEAHGGALWNRIRTMLPEEWNIDSGAVYRVLRDLEQRGSVQSTWTMDESGPPKRVYRITDAGKQEVMWWRKDIQLRKQNLESFLQMIDKHIQAGALKLEGEGNGE